MAVHFLFQAFLFINIIKQDIHMLPIAAQTAGPNELTFFEGTHGYPGGNIGYTNSKFLIFQKIQVFSQKWIFSKFKRLFLNLIFKNFTGNAGPFS